MQSQCLLLRAAVVQHELTLRQAAAPRVGWGPQACCSRPRLRICWHDQRTSWLGRA